MKERDREVLSELEAQARCGGWARPLDVGGRNGDDTSNVLRRLVVAGLAETRQRGGSVIASGPDAWALTKARHSSRGSRAYRITPEGKAQLRRTRTEKR